MFQLARLDLLRKLFGRAWRGQERVDWLRMHDGRARALELSDV